MELLLWRVLGWGIPVAVAWRSVALLAPSTAIDVPASLRWPLAGLGLLFVACAVAVARRRRDPAAVAFSLYCVASAIHWGGGIGGTPALERSLLVFYAAVSFAGELALLWLAWWVVARSTPPSVRLAVVPAVIVCLAPVAVVLNDEAVQGVAALLLLLGTVATLIVAVLLLRAAFFRRTARSVPGLRAATLAMLASVILAQAGAAGAFPAPGGEAQVYQLLLAGVPIAWAWLLLRPRGTRPTAAA